MTIDGDLETDTSKDRLEVNKVIDRLEACLTRAFLNCQAAGRRCIGGASDPRDSRDTSSPFLV